MHGPQIESILKMQDLVLSSRPPPSPLKRKLRVDKRYANKPHTCNHGGKKGRAGRRSPGWCKHGKGPANVSR